MDFQCSRIMFRGVRVFNGLPGGGFFVLGREEMRQFPMGLSLRIVKGRSDLPGKEIGRELSRGKFNAGRIP